MTAKQLDQLRSLLPASEVIEQDDPRYRDQSVPWSIYADQKPTLVLKPTTLESMSKAVKALYESDLDFAVRNTGTGSVSAKDVILSTQGFKDFSFDQKSEVVTLGSGYSWGEVDALMEEHAPGYQCVGARCTWVGITGSALVGGLSWLSHEFGMISDPQNLLDMQVVLRDGRVLWASEEPDLMWALRGGGGNFGVVTNLKLRARPYTSNIFIGFLLFPYSSLEAVSKGVKEMCDRPADPKVAMHVTNSGPGVGEPVQGAKPGIAIFMYDANGEKHGRSDEGFGWAYKIPGVREKFVQESTLRNMNLLGEGYRDWASSHMFWLCAPMLAEVDDHTLVRAWKWWEDSINLRPELDDASTVLFEYMTPQAMSSAGGRDKAAWPHQGRRHVMQLGLGCSPEYKRPDLREVIMDQFAKAGPQIAGEGQNPKEFHAGFLYEWHNLHEVYGENLPKLKEVKVRYDPKNRFNKGVDLMNESVNASY